jgi:hypothetical protein
LTVGRLKLALGMHNPLWRCSLVLLAVILNVLLGAAAMAVAPDSAPIAYWKFDEASGDIASDSSGNGHTGTIVGATWVSGKTGGAVSFDGIGNYLFASDAQSGGTTGAGLDMGTRDWTAAAWINTTGSGMVLTKMGFVGGSNPDGWGLSVSQNGTVGAVIHKSNGSIVNIFSGDGALVNDGQWHHIAVVFSRAGSMTRYVDGLRSGARYGLASLSGQSINNSRQVRIGARDQAGDEIFFPGLIDDARIYAAALSAQGIAALAGVEPPPEEATLWSDPLSLVSAHGRVAVANRVHVVGHSGSSLVHRSSQDNGATWSAPKVVARAASNYTMQYGGLYALGDTVYLLTAAGDMGAISQPLDFRKSTNNGATWSNPIRITKPGQEIRRANIVAVADTVHVFGGQSGAGGYGTGIFYFRSTNGGVSWEPGKLLYANADASARMAVDATTVHVCFGAKLTPNSFGGRSSYMRSTDNGRTWSEPVSIGEDSDESKVQARQQIGAADGHVFAIWQREPIIFGGTLPPDRLGYNRSDDGGLTWTGPKLLPNDTGVNREHQQIWMIPNGAVHVAWTHGSPDVASSPTGYMYSLDYGQTWSRSEIAISTGDAANLPHGVVADTNWVHIMAEPGAGTYARRPSPRRPGFTSVIMEGDQIRLTWSGQGTLQQAQEVTGPWNSIPTATSPYPTNTQTARLFFRLVAQ